MRFSIEKSRLRLTSFVLATWLVLVGCVPRASDSPMACRVLVDGTPALEVRLVLLRSDRSEFKPVLEGISDSGGDIAMRFVEGAELPSGTEFELTAVIESVGSGEWQVKTPWSDPKKTPLKVKWPPSSGRLDIELPKKAIRPI